MDRDERTTIERLRAIDETNCGRRFPQGNILGQNDSDEPKLGFSCNERDPLHLAAATAAPDHRSPTHRRHAGSRPVVKTCLKRPLILWAFYPSHPAS